MDSQTWRRLKVLAFLPLAPAVLSLFGSLLTLLTIYRRRLKQNKLTTYHRLMTGISIFDCMISTALAFGPLPMPAETGLPWAHGTTASCSAQSFFMQLGSGSFAYSAMLMVYFVLVIHYNWTERTIATRIEPVMHLLPTVYYTTTALLGLGLTVYNPQGLSCWVGGWPSGCEDEPEMECERGGTSVTNLYGTWLVVVPFFIWNCIIIICLVIVVWSVVHRFRSSRRFAFDGSDEATRRGEQEMRDVVIRCFCYALVFCNVMVWSTVATVFYWSGWTFDSLGKHFWITVLALTCLPFHGLFNFIIFIFPQYLYMRRRYEMGRWGALCAAVWGLRSIHSSASRTTNSRPTSSTTPGQRRRPSASSSKTCPQTSSGTLALVAPVADAAPSEALPASKSPKDVDGNRLEQNKNTTQGKAQLETEKDFIQENGN